LLETDSAVRILARKYHLYINPGNKVAHDVIEKIDRAYGEDVRRDLRR